MRGNKFRHLLAVLAMFSGTAFGTVAWSEGTRVPVSLNASQVVAIQNELSAALSQVNSRAFSSAPAKDLALEVSVEQVAQAEIRMVGRDSAGPIASVIIAVALRNSTSATVIGKALGRVAVQISTCRASGEDAACDSAKEIARTIANEGTSVMVDAFVSAVSSAGGSVDLSSVALSVPEVTAAIPGSVAGHRYGNNLPPPPPPPACGNPSCT